jgi:hypothetical protein
VQTGLNSRVSKPCCSPTHAVGGSPQAARGASRYPAGGTWTSHNGWRPASRQSLQLAKLAPFLFEANVHASTHVGARCKQPTLMATAHTQEHNGRRHAYAPVARQCLCSPPCSLPPLHQHTPLQPPSRAVASMEVSTSGSFA